MASEYPNLEQQERQARGEFVAMVHGLLKGVGSMPAAERAALCKRLGVEVPRLYVHAAARPGDSDISVQVKGGWVFNVDIELAGC